MKKEKTKNPEPRAKKVRLRTNVAFGPKNYALLAAGLLLVALGFWRLGAGSITLAPILLVLGYCVVIPLALVLR